jgi:TolA-binding protein
MISICDPHPGLSMRHAIIAVSLATGFLSASAALAQSAPVEVRVDRLEKEMRAVQRKVFPGGTPIEAEITRPPVAPVQAGSPASTPIADLTSRVDALEAQLATITGQTEENSFKIKQLEDAFARYKADMDSRMSAASPPPSVVPTKPAASATPAAAPKPANAATGQARVQAVMAVERPETGDAPLDGYTYGFRLWSAKFYPEAQAQLKSTLEKYASGPIASRTANLLGRAYLDDGKADQAALTFLENYQKRPNGDRAAESLARTGDALIALNQPAKACKVYSELEQNYGEGMSASLRDMMVKGRARAKCG